MFFFGALKPMHYLPKRGIAVLSIKLPNCFVKMETICKIILKAIFPTGTFPVSKILQTINYKVPAMKKLKKTAFIFCFKQLKGSYMYR